MNASELPPISPEIEATWKATHVRFAKRGVKASRRGDGRKESRRFRDRF